MKIKSFFGIIFTYILLTGCESTQQYTDEGGCQEYYLELTAPSLNNSNGYYTLQILSDYNQTFATLDAKTGSNEYQKLRFISNKEININGYWINMIDSHSYTDEDGIAHAVLGAWPEFVGDTATVYCGYEDECYFHRVDSIKVIITN